MTLELLVQGLERLRFGLQSVPLDCQHPRRHVIGSVGVASFSLIGGREPPELGHQGHHFRREPGQRA